MSIFKTLNVMFYEKEQVMDFKVALYDCVPLKTFFEPNVYVTIEGIM